MGAALDVQDDRRAEWVAYVVLFACVGAALLNSFRIEKHLSADGVHYFRTILDGAGFCRVDPARWFAETLIQWPLVLAVRAGVTHVPALTMVFAAGILLPWVISFGLCVWAVRCDNPTVLALPILAMACVDLPSDAILAGEHHVMALLAPPVLLLVLRRDAHPWRDGIPLLLALLAFTRTYPTALLPALLFAVLLAGRLAADRRDTRLAAVRAFALLLSLATVVTGAASILSPRDATNRDLFRVSLRAITADPELLLPAAFSLLFLIALAGRQGPWLALAAIPLVLFAPYALWAASGLKALDSFAARTLTATLLPLLLLLTVVVHARRSVPSRPALGLLGAAILAFAGADVRRSAGWSHYRDGMLSLLETQKGFLPIEATDLDHDPCRWGWTSPDLSVVWSWPVVRAIVLNRSDEAWEPFDPRRTLVLKKYVLYDPVFADVDPTARFVRATARPRETAGPAP